MDIVITYTYKTDKSDNETISYKSDIMSDYSQEELLARTIKEFKKIKGYKVIKKIEFEVK